MKMTQRVSFPGTRQFEQYTAEFTIEEEDVSPEVFGACNLLEKMFVLNILVSIEGLLFQYAKGFISREEYVDMKKRLYSLLTPKLGGIVDTLLKKETESGS